MSKESKLSKSKKAVVKGGLLNDLQTYRNKLEKLLKNRNILISIAVCILVVAFISMKSYKSSKSKESSANISSNSTSTNQKNHLTKELKLDDDLWRGSQEDKISELAIDAESKALEIENLKNSNDKNIEATNDELESLKKSNADLNKKLEFLSAIAEEIYAKQKAKEKEDMELARNSLNNPSEPDTKNINIINVGARSKLQRASNTIPANSFVDAVILQGSDISTASTSASDPKPMMFEITNTRQLPKFFGEGYHKCLVSAASVAEISTRRVSARLESMTCQRKNTDDRVTVKIHGYVSGEDGKEGIRGTLLDTNLDMLANSFMGGALSNVTGSQKTDIIWPFGGNNKQSANSTSPAPNPNVGSSILDNITSGVMGGASESSNRLSKYYIDQAEKRQPIIQISAGRKVNIVFTSSSKVIHRNYKIEEGVEGTVGDAREKNSSNSISAGVFGGARKAPSKEDLSYGSDNISRNSSNDMF